jgi:hypothetical protein
MRAKSSRTRVRLMGLAVVTSACLALPAAASSSGASQPSGPPRGLTPYGREVWQLDALLHDTFGKQVVSLEGVRDSENFTTRFVAISGGGQYTYTFANASHSTFKLTRLTRPPKTFYNRIDGFTQPFTVRGAYISCGRQRWLYEDYVTGSANAWIACLSPPSITPVLSTARLGSAPVGGLTASYGHYLWELDALLHDTFGNSPVYSRSRAITFESINFTGPMTPARSRDYRYTYTFMHASHSSLRLMRPTHPPQAMIGGTSGSYPFTVDGAYISCGENRWLYDFVGDPNINDFVSCE